MNIFYTDDVTHQNDKTNVNERQEHENVPVATERATGLYFFCFLIWLNIFSKLLLKTIDLKAKFCL